MARRIDLACRDIERWLSLCSRPCVSVSGGKDSTALLQLVRMVDPSVPAVRAEPPNPLPGRADHVAELQSVAGGLWHVAPYPWDVEAVLRGEQRYPAQLKIRTLERLHRDLGHDGVALGIRAAESKQRSIHLRRRGTVYQLAAGGWRCCPLAWWSAEEVIGFLLVTDRLPMNPVYRHTERMPDACLEHLRDGTWWPHGLYPEQLRPWLAIHYPDVVEMFDRALVVGAAEWVDE